MKSLILSRFLPFRYLERGVEFIHEGEPLLGLLAVLASLVRELARLLFQLLLPAKDLGHSKSRKQKKEKRRKRRKGLYLLR